MINVGDWLLYCLAGWEGNNFHRYRLTAIYWLQCQLKPCYQHELSATHHSQICTDHISVFTITTYRPPLVPTTYHRLYWPHTSEINLFIITYWELHVLCHVSELKSNRSTRENYSYTNQVWYRVGKWWCHKNYFSEIMDFVQLFWMTYMRKVHIPKNGCLVHQTAGIWAFEVQIAPY